MSTLSSSNVSNRTARRRIVVVMLSTLPLAAHPDPVRDAPSLPAVVSPPMAAGLLPVKPRVTGAPTVVLPPPEPDPATGAALSSPFGKVPAATTGQTLTAPVTVNANTSADALTVTQSGGGRAINGAVTSSSNVLSAVKGITAGSGSGVNGVNSGTKGQAGKFEITNASSAQASLLVTTTGTGNAVQAVVKSASGNLTPAVLGQNTVGGVGIGVEGDGGYFGVYGVTTAGFGVAGSATTGIAVNGYSEQGTAIYGGSSSTDSSAPSAIYGASTNYTGVYGRGDNAFGVQGNSAYGIGVYGGSNSNIGVNGNSTNSVGVVGTSSNYIGVYGKGGSYGGYFIGPVYVSGAVSAASYGYTSDREQKQDVAAIDADDLLNRIAVLPITSWGYKAKPAERHVGPMAQDFRAAFGLGTDDKHIDVVDGIGVSLAAIQELQRQGKAKDVRAAEQDARIAALEAQLQAVRLGLDARMAALEQATAEAVAGVRAP